MCIAVLTNLNKTFLTPCLQSLLMYAHQRTNEVAKMKREFNKTRVKLANPYFDRYYRAVPRQQPASRPDVLFVPVILERSIDSTEKVLQ